MIYKIAIVGSDTYPRPFELDMVLNNLFASNDKLIFLSRRQNGVDKYAEEFIDMLVEEGFPIAKMIYADDETLVQAADLLMIFWNGKCLRTKKLLDLGIKYHKETCLHIRRE